MNLWGKSEKQLYCEIIAVENNYPKRDYYCFFRLKLMYFLLKKAGSTDAAHSSKRKRVTFYVTDTVGSQHSEIHFFDYFINIIGILIFRFIRSAAYDRHSNTFNLKFYYHCLQYVRYLSFFCWSRREISTKPFYSNLRVLLANGVDLIEEQHGLIFSFHAGYFPIPQRVKKIKIKFPITKKAFDDLLSHEVEISGHEAFKTPKLQIQPSVSDDTSPIMIIDQPAFEARIKDFIDNLDHDKRLNTTVRLHPNRNTNPYGVPTTDKIDIRNIFVGINSTLLFELPEKSRVYLLDDRFWDILDDK